MWFMQLPGHAARNLCTPFLKKRGLLPDRFPDSSHQRLWRSGCQCPGSSARTANTGSTTPNARPARAVVIAFNLAAASARKVYWQRGAGKMAYYYCTSTARLVYGRYAIFSSVSACLFAGHLTHTPRRMALSIGGLAIDAARGTGRYRPCLKSVIASSSSSHPLRLLAAPFLRAASYAYLRSRESLSSSARLADPRTTLLVSAAVQRRIRGQAPDLLAHSPVHSVNVTSIESTTHHSQRSAQGLLLLLKHARLRFVRRTIKTPLVSPLVPPPPLFPLYLISPFMPRPTLQHSQSPSALAPQQHSIHARLPSDDMFPFPRAASSLSSPSPHDNLQMANAQKATDGPLFSSRLSAHPLSSADVSPSASPIAPQPRSHFASVTTESNLTRLSGAALSQYLSSAAEDTYQAECDDMSQYLSLQDFDAQPRGTANAASPPSTAPPSFQGSPASWPADIDGAFPQQNNNPQQMNDMYAVFPDLHQHDFPGTYSSLNLMTGNPDFGFGGSEGDYFLPPWAASDGNAFHMQPPSSQYELGLGDDVDVCKDSQQQMQHFVDHMSQPPAQDNSPLQFRFPQGSSSPPFFPATPPRQRLPFPIQVSSDGQSPSPGIAPRELELSSGPPPSLSPSPTFSPTSAPATTAVPRWAHAFDVPRSQALDIQQHTPTSPSFAQSPRDVGYIPPPPISTAPEAMPMPFSQIHHGYGQPYYASRAHGGRPASPLRLAQMLQPASAPSHPGGDIHAHRSSRMRTYSQRAGSALRDALRAEAFASGNASQSQPRSNHTALNLSSAFDDGRGGQQGGVGPMRGINGVEVGGGMMDVDDGRGSGTIRGSASGMGVDVSSSRLGSVDPDATVRKKKRTSARLATPSPHSRMRSLPRDATPGSEGSVDRDRDREMPARSELRPPKLAPSTWQLYFTDWIQRHQSMHGGDKKLNVAQAAKEAGAEYANLTPEQKEVRLFLTLGTPVVLFPFARGLFALLYNARSFRFPCHPSTPTSGKTHESFNSTLFQLICQNCFYFSSRPLKSSTGIVR